jgi:hypothetical protein
MLKEKINAVGPERMKETLRKGYSDKDQEEN